MNLGGSSQKSFTVPSYRPYKRLQGQIAGRTRTTRIKNEKIKKNDSLVTHSTQPIGRYILPPARYIKRITPDALSSRTNVSRYVDSLVNRNTPTFSSFIKNTNQFLKDILGIGVPDGSLLITLDVWSLYTNIPHYDSIFAFNEAYDDCRSDKPVGGEIFGTLMKLMFDLNNFECDNSHYVQSNGASLSTRVGPNYAKMFMGILEANFIENWHLKQCF